MLPVQRYIGLLLVAALLCTGCSNWWDKDDQLPAYLHIEAIKLNTNYTTQGTSAHNITDVWVSVDQNLVGMYELPATLPVLEEGVRRINIQGGIKQNGIAATRILYPFTVSYETKHELNPMEVDTLEPTIRYFSNEVIRFAWLEDFEQGMQLDTLANSTSISRVDAPDDHAYLKNKVAHATLTDADPMLEIYSSEVIQNPQNQREVYLELHYKSNIAFQVGVLVFAGGEIHRQPKVTVNPAAEWNKIYIDLSEEVSNFTNDFHVLFHADKRAHEVSMGNVYLDNVKLVHFKN